MQVSAAVDAYRRAVSFIPYPVASDYPLRIDVIGQANLAAHWYAEAREALDDGDHERAVEMQERAAIRWRFSHKARIAWQDAEAARRRKRNK